MYLHVPTLLVIPGYILINWSCTFITPYFSPIQQDMQSCFGISFFNTRKAKLGPHHGNQFTVTYVYSHPSQHQVHLYFGTSIFYIQNKNTSHYSTTSQPGQVRSHPHTSFVTARTNASISPYSVLHIRRYDSRTPMKCIKIPQVCLEMSWKSI